MCNLHVCRNTGGGAHASLWIDSRLKPALADLYGLGLDFCAGAMKRRPECCITSILWNKTAAVTGKGIQLWRRLRRMHGKLKEMCFKTCLFGLDLFSVQLSLSTLLLLSLQILAHPPAATRQDQLGVHPQYSAGGRYRFPARWKGSSAWSPSTLMLLVTAAAALGM